MEVASDFSESFLATAFILDARSILVLPTILRAVGRPTEAASFLGVEAAESAWRGEVERRPLTSAASSMVLVVGAMDERLELGLDPDDLLGWDFLSMSTFTLCIIPMNLRTGIVRVVGDLVGVGAGSRFMKASEALEGRGLGEGLGTWGWCHSSTAAPSSWPW